MAASAAIFHGHGVGELPDKKDRILRYFQKVDAGLNDILADQQAPLVLAGVDYLLPIYQQANSYPHLLTDGITGDPEDVSDEDLHRQALDIVLPILTQIGRMLNAASANWTETNWPPATSPKSCQPRTRPGSIRCLSRSIPSAGAGISQAAPTV